MLGIRLGLTFAELGIIRKDKEHCMRDLLSKWKQKYPNKGWRDIISALRKMDRNDVADKVKRQYISSSPGIALQRVINSQDIIVNFTNDYHRL